MIAVLAIALMSAVAAVGPAKADSCWMHNNSLMRLVASGTERRFIYEAPRQGLRATGVRRGTLLFNGHNRQGWYSGHARVFSSHCPNTPLAYWVEGPVSDGQLRVTMRGTRELHQRCQPTGRFVTDTLVFTYSHRC